MKYQLLTCLVMAASALPAATPEITSLRPVAVTAGSAAMTLTVMGSGFSSPAFIQWNDTVLPTAAASLVQLVAVVPASMLSLAGTATVKVSNADGTASAAAQITIAPAIAILNGQELPAATKGRLYTQALVLTGGTAPFRFSLERGTLPAGISLDATTGALAGIPSAQGNHEFTIRVTDASQTTAIRTFTLGVFGELAILTAALPRAIAGVGYSIALNAAGGAMPYSNWQAISGALPPGIALSQSTGMLAGTATAAGTYQFTVRLRDQSGLTAAKVFTLEVTAPLTIPPVEIPAVTPGVRLSYRIMVSGGAGPYIYSVRDGLLPPGVSLNSDDGTIDGAVSAAATWRATVQVYDASGQSASTPLTITAVDALAIAGDGKLAAATLGAAYSQTLSAAGGTPPYRFTLGPGALPSGIALDAATGMFSGTAAAAGSFTFSVVVSDTAGRTTSRAFRIEVALPTVPALRFISMPDNVAAAEQTRVALAIAAAYPTDLTGAVELTLAQAPDDPGVVFSNGRRKASFRIAAGMTEAQFDNAALGIQTGTNAGTIALQAAFDGRPGDPASHVIYVRTSAPVVTEARIVPAVGGFEVVLSGYSPTRELTQAVFRFAGAAGAANIAAAEIVAPLRTMAGEWYQAAESHAFGAQFTYRQSFQMTAPLTALGTVTAVVANTIGESAMVEMKP